MHDSLSLNVPCLGTACYVLTSSILALCKNISGVEFLDLKSDAGLGTRSETTDPCTESRANLDN